MVLLSALYSIINTYQCRLMRLHHLLTKVKHCGVVLQCGSSCGPAAVQLRAGDRMLDLSSLCVMQRDRQQRGENCVVIHT